MQCKLSKPNIKKWRNLVTYQQSADISNNIYLPYKHRASRSLASFQISFMLGYNVVELKICIAT